MKLVWLAAVILIALSGCLQSASDGEPPREPGTGQPSQGPPHYTYTEILSDTPIVGLVDCWLEPITIPVPWLVAREHLPEGYYPRSLLGEGVTSSIVIHNYQCAAATIGNSTVREDVAIAAVTLAAARDEPEEGMPESVLYDFEWFADDPLLVTLLDRAGFNAYAASIETKKDNESWSFHVAVDNTTWYEAAGAAGDGAGGPTDGPIAYYYRLENGTHVAAVADIDGNVGGLTPYHGTLQAHTGFIKDFLAPADPDYAFAILPGPLDGTISFHVVQAS